MEDVVAAGGVESMSRVPMMSDGGAWFDDPEVARATGFLHGQDRFFQMDLMRRRAAGEMAEILGPAVVALDRRNRIHRFRVRAGRASGSCWCR